MLKVLLVDDESLVIEGLMNLIPWSEMGLYICSTAMDGEEAYEKILELKPDILVTDVRMPKMDGVTLSCKVKESHPETEIIILSGYDDFNYAKQALSIGVSEYILKPAEVHELIAILSKIKEKVKTRIQLSQEYSNMKQRLIEQIPIIKNQLLFSLLYGQIYEEYESLVEKFSYCQINLSFAPYYVIKIKLNQKESDSDFENKYTIKIYQKKVIDMLFASLGKYEILQEENNWYVILEDNEFEDFSELMGKLGYQIKECIYNISAQNVFIGISSLKQSYFKMKEALSECETALENRSFDENAVCVMYEDIVEQSFNVDHLDYEWLSIFILRIKMLQKEKAAEIFYSKISELKANGATFFNLYTITACALAELYNFCLGVNVKSDALQLLHSEIQHAKKCFTSDDLEDCVRNSIDIVCNSVNIQASLFINEIIEKAIEYIDNNLSDDITLLSAANYVHMSKNYFCNLFKKHMNETFVNFLTKKRINKAKELLITSNYKINEISQMVGYKEYAYFFQVFKKITGLAAGEYREKFLK